MGEGFRADAVILDLEDGVAASAKPSPRRALREGIDAASCPILVRVNARLSDDYSLDLDAVRDLGLAGAMLAKAETAADLEATSAATGAPVVALIETARAPTRRTPANSASPASF